MLYMNLLGNSYEFEVESYFLKAYRLERRLLQEHVYKQILIVEIKTI